MSKVPIGDQDYFAPPKYDYGRYVECPPLPGCVPYNSQDEIKELKKRIEELEEKLEKAVQSAVYAACAFDTFPVFMPRPDVSVTPSGSVSFDWQYNKDKILSVIVSSEGNLGISSLIGGSSKVHEEQFDMESISPEIYNTMLQWKSYPSSNP